MVEDVVLRRSVVRLSHQRALLGHLHFADQLLNEVVTLADELLESLVELVAVEELFRLDSLGRGFVLGLLEGGDLVALARNHLLQVEGFLGRTLVLELLHEVLELLHARDEALRVQDSGLERIIRDLLDEVENL